MRRFLTAARRWREVIENRPRRGNGEPDAWEIEAFRRLTFNDVRRRSQAATSKGELGEPWHMRYLEAAYVWRQLEAEMRAKRIWNIDELEPKRFSYWVRLIDLIDPDGLGDGRTRPNNPGTAPSARQDAHGREEDPRT